MSSCPFPNLSFIKLKFFLIFFMQSKTSNLMTVPRCQVLASKFKKTSQAGIVMVRDMKLAISLVKDSPVQPTHSCQSAAKNCSKDSFVDNFPP